MSRRICFIGGTRYRRPLDASTAKKFSILASLGDVWVIGVAPSVRPARFIERGATFYLLPNLRVPLVGDLVFAMTSFLACGWCLAIHRCRIVVAQSPYEAVLAAVLKSIARLLGRRIVLIVEGHGDFAASLLHQRTVRGRAWYRRMLQTAAAFGLRSANLLRAVSDTTAAQLRAAAGPRPVVTFQTWTDLDVFFTAGEARSPEDHILYAGVLTPLKGVEVLLDALSRLSSEPVDLYLIGRPIAPAYVAGLRRRAQDAGIDRRVHFVDHLPQNELAAHMARARVFVLPSFTEGRPRVVLEAMAVGTPVVGTAVPGIAEIIEDGVTGWLVPAGDAAALAARLQWVFEHPDDAAAVGRTARKVAQQRFSVAAYRQGYGSLFEFADAILGARSPRPAAERDA